MTRKERRRLLDADRKLAFGEELSALFDRYGYRRRTRYLTLAPREDGETEPMRFVVDDEGDLVLVSLRGRETKDEDTIAEYRRQYEERVASGKYDNSDDTDGDEEVAEPEAKPKLTKLSLPLEKGQRVVLRDGSTEVVENTERDERIRTSKGWHKRDTGQYGRTLYDVEHRFDIVADAKPKPKATAKAKLTLPLTAGQKVVRRDGKIVTVITVEGTGDFAVAHIDLAGPNAVWANTGQGDRTREVAKDIVADAKD